MPTTRSLVPVLCAAVLLASGACGPSFQTIYEGDVRFERCYALEETQNTPLQTRADCWRDWTLHYGYGQTRDRMEYAAARYRALSRVPSSPTDDAMMAAAPGEGRASTVVTPAPTSAFAPPPKTLAIDAGPPPVPFEPTPNEPAPGTPSVGRIPPEAPEEVPRGVQPGTRKNTSK